MGHFTAIIEVPQEMVTEPDNRTQSSNWNRGSYYRRSKESEIVSTAVSIWRNDQAGRWDDENAGEPVLLNAVPRELANDEIDKVFRKDGYNVSPVVPLIDTRDYEIKTKTVTVKLVGEEWKQHLGIPMRNVVMDKIKEQLPDIADAITGYSVIREDKKAFYSNPTEGWTVRSSVDADTSGGKAKTVYKLAIDGHSSTSEEYSSQAEARAAGVKLIESDSRINSVAVSAKVVREDNTALVKLTRNVKQATAKLTVSYFKMKTDKPRTEGYLVAFDYHS